MKRGYGSASKLRKVPNSSVPGSAVGTPVIRPAATTPVTTLATEHRSHEFLEFFVLRGVGTLESSFTTSSTPPPNEQCSGKQPHRKLRSASDACVSDCRNCVHVQIGHIAECQTTADVTTCKDKGDWRVCALTPFGNESFAGLE